MDDQKLSEYAALGMADNAVLKMPDEWDILMVLIIAMFMENPGSLKPEDIAKLKETAEQYAKEKGGNTDDVQQTDERA